MTVEAVRNWQRDNQLGIETITPVSELNPADRARFGTQETITTYIVDGIIDVDDWAIILAAPSGTKSDLPASLVNAPATSSTAGALKIDLGDGDFIQNPEVKVYS